MGTCRPCRTYRAMLTKISSLCPARVPERIPRDRSERDLHRVGLDNREPVHLHRQAYQRGEPPRLHSRFWHRHCTASNDVDSGLLQMVDYNIGSLQPRLDPFVAENVSHQKVLKDSVSSLSIDLGRYFHRILIDMSDDLADDGQQPVHLVVAHRWRRPRFCKSPSLPSRLSPPRLTPTPLLPVSVPHRCPTPSLLVSRRPLPSTLTCGLI